MFITIKRLDASKVQMEVDEKQPVTHLKQVVAEKTGINGDQLRFVHKGNVLLEDRSLVEQRVLPNDTVHLILNLVGGTRPAAASAMLMCEHGTPQTDGDNDEDEDDDDDDNDKDRLAKWYTFRYANRDSGDDDVQDCLSKLNLPNKMIEYWCAQFSHPFESNLVVYEFAACERCLPVELEPYFTYSPYGFPLQGNQPL